nr:reverse transcriptase domain-containing protein [Tanacetum cinerariifolium]
MPTTTTMFAATTPENMPLGYRASTLTNPSLVISLAFLEANYETLESLLRAVTPPLHAASPRVHRRRERVVKFKETQNKGESRVERNKEGGRPLKEASRGNESQNVNLPSLLAAHIGRTENGQPLQSSLTFAYEGQALPNNIGRNLPHNAYGLPFANSGEKPPIGEALKISHKKGITSKAEYQGKIGPTWEGPYRVRKSYGGRADKLEMLSGEAIDRTWNETNLRKFYV